MSPEGEVGRGKGVLDFDEDDLGKLAVVLARWRGRGRVGRDAAQAKRVQRLERREGLEELLDEQKISEAAPK